MGYDSGDARAWRAAYFAPAMKRRHTLPSELLNAHSDMAGGRA